VIVAGPPSLGYGATEQGISNVEQKEKGNGRIAGGSPALSAGAGETPAVRSRLEACGAEQEALARMRELHPRRSFVFKSAVERVNHSLRSLFLSEIISLRSAPSFGPAHSNFYSFAMRGMGNKPQSPLDLL